MNIVITGASRGLGKAIAERFAADDKGHGLFLSAQQEEPLRSFSKELQARYPRATVHSFPSDLSAREGVDALIQWLSSLDLPIDVLVNNAGRFLPGSLHLEPEGTLEAMMNLNLYSAYYLTKAVMPGMLERKSGHIFNMCSVASLGAYPNGGSYSVSKYALLGFSKNLREEIKSYGIKVTAVLPGAVYTDSWSGAGIAPERLMDPTDIAEMVYTAAFLSPRAVPEEILLRPQLGDL